MKPKVSLFASAVREELYEDFMQSLEGTSVECEVVFAGNKPLEKDYPGMTYILTENIKPAQCYEVARRACQGEVVVWVADDCEFPNDVIGKAYKYWKEQGNEKLILSIQTKESGYGSAKATLFPMNAHRFFGGNNSSPLMAPLGMMSRKLLENLGGFDKRYICGQYENMCVMMAYMEGASVEIFGDNACCIVIDHLEKSIRIGESKDRYDFQKRPFASGYAHDRKILESSFSFKNGKVERILPFEPYSDKDIKVYSQSHKGGWI